MANQNVDDFVSACRRLCDEENYQEAAKLAILFQASQKSVPLGRMNAAFDAMVSPKFTIVMVALLACKLRSPLDKDKDWKQLGPQIQTLVAVMDTERVFLVRDQFHFIIHELTKSLLKRNVPASGIQLVLAAIQRSCPNGQVLSPIHADLCHLCLAAKNFKPVLPLLEADIRDLQVSSKGKFDATAFLLYYFYGGRIYAALKEYNKAKFFFTAAVTCPATHLSGIVVEAYKRLCFVSILATGEGPKLPAYASTAVRPLGQKDDLLFPYADICQCYKRRDLEEYDTLLAQHKSLLVTEEMKGLVKQVRKALVKQKILHVIKIFMTTTVQEVAVRAGIQDTSEVENCVVELMLCGDIRGSIDKSAGTMTFEDQHDQRDHQSYAHFGEQTAKRIERETEMLEFLTRSEQEVEVMPRYIRRLADILAMAKVDYEPQFVDQGASL